MFVFLSLSHILILDRCSAALVPLVESLYFSCFCSVLFLLLSNLGTALISDWDFPGGSDGKESACSAGGARDAGSIPESGRSPGEGNGKPLHYSCLENSMDRGVWQATDHGVAKSWT